MRVAASRRWQAGDPGSAESTQQVRPEGRGEDPVDVGGVAVDPDPADDRIAAPRVAEVAREIDEMHAPAPTPGSLGGRIGQEGDGAGHGARVPWARVAPD